MKDFNITLRSATHEDLSKLQELFVETIKSTCKNDYTQEQINVWVISIENKDRWIDKLKSQYFIIAEIEGKIVGFGSLENGDYLDFLYVHKDFLRKGIANRIYHELEKESIRTEKKHIISDVSITARPFFEKKGFKVEKENRNIVKGIEVINFRMRKEI